MIFPYKYKKIYAIIIQELCYRCSGCKDVSTTLHEIAKSNRARRYNITIARVDCSVETDLCGGKQISI